MGTNARQARHVNDDRRAFSCSDAAQTYVCWTVRHPFPAAGVAMTVPEPRATHEQIRRCTRHHIWHVNCPDCCAWHRDLLRVEREKAAEREARR